MANQQNYYEMTYRLYSMMCEIVNTSNKDFTELYEKSRAIIFDYNVLKEKYLNIVRSIYKYTQKKEFTDVYEKEYNLIQDSLKQRAKNREVALKYNKEIWNDNKVRYDANAQFTSVIEKQYKHLDKTLDWDNWDEGLLQSVDGVLYTFNEYPEYFYYSSCQAIRFDDFTQYDEECIELEKDINIEVCLGLKQFYMENFHCSVDVPKDFEYYISSFNFSITDDFNLFDKSFYITAMYYVLADLYKYVQNRINELYGMPIKYIDKNDSRMSEIHTCEITTLGPNPIILDKKPLLTVSPAQINFIKAVNEGKIKGNVSKYKQIKYNINKAIKNELGYNVNFILWNRQKKVYYTNTFFNIDINEK